MDKIIEKLRKIKELADGGLRGEAITAKKKLEEGLSRHGLSLADLEDVKRSPRKFKYFYGAEKELILQIVMKELQLSSINYVSYKKKKLISVELSDIEYLEVQAQVDFHVKQYRKELRKRMETFYQAYLAKHRIYGASSGEESESSLSDQEIAEIILMAQGLEDVSYYKSLKE